MIELLKQHKDLYDLFTKQEEYNSQILDRYQRFPYYLGKHRDIFEPIVSKFLINNGLTIDYPDDKKFAICLTHDIDSVYLSKKAMISRFANSVMNNNIKDAHKILFHKLNKKWNPFGTLVKLCRWKINMTQNLVFIF